ncbi:MAG: UvrB/UvrC motif-containing protein [Peptoniphilus sp.]|nr:UvrB/UvrC motif-containing protein [Peptoniphilus sp.]MDY3118819.1 UvrB/UvrC motif-containing protein [Peptoniphilus sp.]
MLCEHCHEKEARITYTTVEGNEIKQMHVCPACFQKFLAKQFPSSPISPVDIQPMIQELLSMFHGKGEGPEDDRICPVCHRSLKEFRKTGMLGCDSCYDTFADELATVLPRIQGATSHVGAVPESFQRDREASEKEAALKDRLDAAVAEERYEDAAQLRDELKALQGERHG